MTSILGKFTTYNTPVHRLDARIKLIAMILIMITAFLPYGNYTNRFIFLGVLTIILVVIMIIGKISFSTFFKSLKSLWFMVLFLLIFMFFIPPSDTTNAHLMYEFSNGYKLYYDGLLQIAHVVWRLVLMIITTSILTSTTSPMDITYSLEWFLTPLKLFKCPIQIISLVISLALRFIPTLLNESQRIMNAQKSRGVDYNRGFLTSKIKSFSTLIIPLLISCFSRSDELAIAMDARGYDPYSKRTRYKKLTFKASDFFYLFGATIVFASFLTMSILSSNVSGYDDIINLIFGVATW